jgi:hypothetical protein
MVKPTRQNPTKNYITNGPANGLSTSVQLPGKVIASPAPNAGEALLFRFDMAQSHLASCVRPKRDATFFPGNSACEVSSAGQLKTSSGDSFAYTVKKIHVDKYFF